MSVEIVRESGDDLLEAINALVPQLSSSTPPLAAEDLNGLLSQQGTVLFVYRDEESGAVLACSPLRHSTSPRESAPGSKTSWWTVRHEGRAPGTSSSRRQSSTHWPSAARRSTCVAAIARDRQQTVPAGRVPASRNKRLPLRRMTPPTKGQLCVSVNRSLRASPV